MWNYSDFNKVCAYFIVGGWEPPQGTQARGVDPVGKKVFEHQRLCGGQVGTRAVADAALAFDQKRGAKLSTYVYTRIRFNMWKALQEETRTVHFTSYHITRLRQLDKAMRKSNRSGGAMLLILKCRPLPSRFYADQTYWPNCDYE